LQQNEGRDSPHRLNLLGFRPIRFRLIMPMRSRFRSLPKITPIADPPLMRGPPATRASGRRSFSWKDRESHSKPRDFDRPAHLDWNKLMRLLYAETAAVKERLYHLV